MLKKSTLQYILFFLLCIDFSVGQVVLDRNQVSALVSNNGQFFRSHEYLVMNQYVVPKDGQSIPIYHSSLWLGATDTENNARISGVRYSLSDLGFFPGPVSSTNKYRDSTYLAIYGESMWKISSETIETHRQNWGSIGYTMPDIIRDWPGNGNSDLGVSANLAPFIDHNSNGIYEPHLGDYPDIRGDEAVYVIFNDLAIQDSTYQNIKLGVEVHAMFYQFSGNPLLDHNTFLQFKVFNRGTENYNDLKLGLYTDFDMGYYEDDYVGCDTNLNLMYVYNQDNYDEDDGYQFGYGSEVPAVAVQTLNNNMRSFAVFTASLSYPYADPVNVNQYMEILNGKWADGSPMVEGGMGYPGSSGSSNVPTRYLFPGNPNDTSQWSMESIYAYPGDVRGVMVMDEENLQSGEFICYDFVFVFAREKGNSRLENVNTLFKTAASLKSFYDSSVIDGCYLYAQSSGRPEIDDFAKIYPNPTDGEVTIEFDSLMNSQIRVLSTSGNELRNQTFNNLRVLTLDLTALPSGIYLIEIQSGDSMTTKKLVMH